MSWPQYIMLGMMALVMLAHGVNDGEPQPPRDYNLNATTFGMSVQVFLLWWGGFFAGGASFGVVQ